MKNILIGTLFAIVSFPCLAGTVKLDENTEGAMADPFTYDASNIDAFSSIF